MSYEVHFANGGNEGSTSNDDSYAILENGVLQLIHAEKGRIPHIVKEFAPGFWLNVAGTRFSGNTRELEGSDGKRVNGGYYKQA